MADKPTAPTLTLASLEAEVPQLEPFVFALSGSKRITIKDPFSFKLSQRAEIGELYQAVQDGRADDLDLLKKLMTAKDFEAYQAADLNLRVHMHLVQRIMDYFQRGLTGEPGESPASQA